MRERPFHSNTQDGDLLGTALQALVIALSTRTSRVPSVAVGDEMTADLPPLLAPGQVASLLGVSRNTIDRMIADGELPSVVLRRGARQQMVRVPKAFVVQLLDDLGAGARISLRDYAARWTAQATLQSGDSPKQSGRHRRPRPQP